ncbi:aspartate aminotransferase family protein [Hyphomicrobium sp. CS1GBMeth3]|uniref:aspartate aminotransferase family protein n=1 Tax=Hyphomicrobium sp. CS1GBMeth3 TaxID=1892845 RepID=UPI0009310BC5|nr:aspartate aminotransferase family protein [Hyphomicrobium sp. CS1GBMeth3]
MATYARQDIVFARGEGCWLETEAGERYLDFGSGVAVNALGHAHPYLVAALTEQAGKLWHTSNLYRVAGQEKLAERLVATTFADRVFFCNSGAEACEGAIKAARRYHFVAGNTERTRIITFHGAFHGRTLTTLAAAGNSKYLEGFGPESPGFDHVPFGDLEAVRAAIGPETAAIMIEPVQGEGGVHVATAEFLQALRTLCDEAGLLLVLDEVQTGVGRTGKLFSHEWTGITPDVMAVAKGIGGGFPLGAILATEAAAAGMTAGTHGSTFGGNPLATAVGQAVLDVVLEPGFIEAVQQKALRLRQGLARLKDQFPDLVTEIRGQGLLTGIKVTAAPADVVAAAREQRLLLVGAGDNVVRVLPPLIVADHEISEAVERLSRALANISEPKT